MTRSGTGSWLVSLTCETCHQDCVRLVPGEPDLVRRCVVCERVAMLRIADRLLASVFGPPPTRDADRPGLST